MVFTLEDLGLNISINNTNFFENILNYCKQCVNGEQTSISSQLLLSQKNKMNSEIEKKLNEELISNLINKRINLLENINKNNFEETILNFLEKYLKGLKYIDIIINSSNIKENNKLYGSSPFIQSNIEQLADLIIFHPKIKNYLSNYIKDEIIKNPEIKLLKLFKKLEDYDIVIFDDLNVDLIEWSLSKTEIPSIYEKECDFIELSYNIYKIKKLNNFIKKNYPKNKNHSVIFLKIFDIIFEKNIPNILKFKNSGLGLLKRYLNDLTKILNFLDEEKKKYYFSFLNTKIQFIFKKINDLDNFIFLLELLESNHLLNTITSVFLKNIESNIFNEILNTILNLDLNQIKTFGTCIASISKIKEEILIRLKYQLSENIWSLSNEDISKVELFNNLIKTGKNIISLMIEDKKTSDTNNLILEPHKMYYFSHGVWDFPMNNDYYVFDNNINTRFNDEIKALNLNLTSNKELVIFVTKGNMLIELEDNIGKLECIFLPIQGMVLKYLQENSSSKNNIINFIKNIGVDNGEKILETLDSLIEIDNENELKIYKLKNKLPYYGTKNFAELYFIETVKIIKQKITDELVLSLDEYLSTNIISTIKKQENKNIEKEKLFNVLQENSIRNFSQEDFDKTIIKLKNKDYIILNQNTIILPNY